MFASELFCKCKFTAFTNGLHNNLDEIIIDNLILQQFVIVQCSTICNVSIDINQFQFLISGNSGLCYLVLMFPFYFFLYFELFEVFYILFYQEWTVSWIFNLKFSNWIPTVCPDSLSQNWHCLICYLFIFSWIEIKNRNNIFECFWVLYNLGLGLCWSFVSDVKVCVDARPHFTILYKYINNN